MYMLLFRLNDATVDVYAAFRLDDATVDVYFSGWLMSVDAHHAGLIPSCIDSSSFWGNCFPFWCHLLLNYDVYYRNYGICHSASSTTLFLLFRFRQGPWTYSITQSGCKFLILLPPKQLGLQACTTQQTLGILTQPAFPHNLVHL